MFSWLMAKFYDKILADAEEKCLREWRSLLLKDLSGEVLELGCGTGANLEFYPPNIKNLVLAEPDQNMQIQLSKKLLQFPNLKTKVLDYNGETFDLPDNSLDAVISTLVLCTVKNPKKILSEIHRVLKPEGKLIFIEHVIAKNNPSRLKWQQRLEPIWKIVACGCHLTRDTESEIELAGFKYVEITRQSMRGVPPIVRPSIHGVAVKSI